MVTRRADRLAARALALAGWALTWTGLRVMRAGGRLNARAIERADPAIRRARMLRERAEFIGPGTPPAVDTIDLGPGGTNLMPHGLIRRRPTTLTSRTPPDGE